jgi:hypothetical protein
MLSLKRESNILRLAYPPGSPFTLRMLTPVPGRHQCADPQIFPLAMLYSQVGIVTVAATPPTGAMPTHQEDRRVATRGNHTTAWHDRGGLAEPHPAEHEGGRFTLSAEHSPSMDPSPATTTPRCPPAQPNPPMCSPRVSRARMTGMSSGWGGRQGGSQGGREFSPTASLPKLPGSSSANTGQGGTYQDPRNPPKPVETRYSRGARAPPSPPRNAPDGINTRVTAGSR